MGEGRECFHFILLFFFNFKQSLRWPHSKGSFARLWKVLQAFATAVKGGLPCHTHAPGHGPHGLLSSFHLHSAGTMLTGGTERQLHRREICPPGAGPCRPSSPLHRGGRQGKAEACLHQSQLRRTGTGGPGHG